MAKLPGAAIIAAAEGDQETARGAACLAPSYESFIATAGQRSAISWHKPAGGAPNVGLLLEAAKLIADADVDIIAVDMPISKKPIIGRRAADDAISKAFGAAWAGTHSPTKE